MKSEPLFGDTRPFASCHASSLAKTPYNKDNYLAVWFGGTHEKHPDVGIWMAERDAVDGWTTPRLLAKINDEAHWNPVIFAPAGELHVWFKVGPTIGGWRTFTMTSQDGKTGSEPCELVPGDTSGGRGPLKNKPIALQSGAWMAGASHEVGGWNAFVDRSEDEGKTWQRSEYLSKDAAVIHGKGVIQPTLWESAPGAVHMLLRSTCGAVCRSDSLDAGRSWSPIYPTIIPNNNSGLDIVRLVDGTLVLCCNPTAGSERFPLSLLVSTDNGETWTGRLDLETEPGEYSYPAIIADGPESVAVTYTWKRKRIVFRRVSLSEIPNARRL
jgi:predicted neuraminidase